MTSQKRKKLTGDLRNRLITESLLDKTGHCYAIATHDGRPFGGFGTSIKGYWLSRQGLIAWAKLNPNSLVHEHGKKYYEELVWTRPESLYTDDLRSLLKLCWAPVERANPLELLARSAR